VSEWVSSERASEHECPWWREQVSLKCQYTSTKLWQRTVFIISAVRILLKPVCDSAEVEPYDCQLCASSFHAKNSLRLHYVVAHISKRMTCDVCGKRFSDPHLFKSHRLFHELESYVCGVCGQQFNSYVGYKIHNRSHQQVMHILELIANIRTLPKWTEKQALIWQTHLCYDIMFHAGLCPLNRFQMKC
jgi:hypothetical protein